MSVSLHVSSYHTQEYLFQVWLLQGHFLDGNSECPQCRQHRFQCRIGR